MLTESFLRGRIAEIRERCDTLEPAELANLDSSMAIDAIEGFGYQQLQAECHALGILSTDAALILYASFNGEFPGGGENGGWAEGVDTATKVTLTLLVSELIAERRRKVIRAA